MNYNGKNKKNYNKVKQGKCYFFGLSRRRQGFKSPWGRHFKTQDSNELLKTTIGIFVSMPLIVPHFGTKA